MNIIPTPKKVAKTENSKKINVIQTVTRHPDFSDAIQSFQEYADKMCDVGIAIVNEGFIRIERCVTYKEEAYGIDISQAGIVIRVSEEVGADHAFATLLQLMETVDGKLLLPELVIEDEPDCSYRGMMIDLARHWHPYEYLLSYVDMCYYYKAAVLHLHFTDNESYTLPSELYPKLSTPERYYTKEQIRELVEYAHKRGVQLLPEIDVPGHCKSFEEGYSELFGTRGVICQHSDSMKAMQMLFGELCDMFSHSKYIHIGGDEAYTMEEWTKCPECIAYAESVGIDTDMRDKRQQAELMLAHFINEMANVCFERGRQPIVWEGFAKSVNDFVSKDIWVMSWENYYQTTEDLLAGGFKVINSSWNPNYVVTPNIMWTPEEVYDSSIYIWRAVHPKSPIRNSFYQGEETTQIIGSQIQAWGDDLGTKCPGVAEGVRMERDCMLERLPMLSEKTWNVKKVTDYPSLEKIMRGWDEAGKRILIH